MYFPHCDGGEMRLYEFRQKAIDEAMKATGTISRYEAEVIIDAFLSLPIGQRTVTCGECGGTGNLLHLSMSTGCGICQGRGEVTESVSLAEGIGLWGGRPKIVVLCGSSRFVDIMAVCAWLIEKEENAIAMGLHLLPRWYCGKVDDHIAEHEGVAEQMDNLHLRKIDLCDEIFVINYDDYIGESTKREIEYAQTHKKKIRWWTHDPITEPIKEALKRLPGGEE